MGKINLNECSVPIREKRLGSITRFQGNAATLVEKSHSCKLKDCAGGFSQCKACNATFAFCQLSMISDVAIVNHAPIGCAGDFFCFNFTYRVEQAKRNLPPRIGRYFSTGIEEKDTVFGAIKKLEATVKEAYERVKPKAIFITTSCASGIIGEDIEQVAESLSNELGIPVISCSCEGFRSKVWTTGFDAAYHSVLRKIVKPPKKKSKKVNIVNFWGSHIFEKLLERLGYEAQYIMPFSTIEDLEKISEAAATIHICPSLSTYMGAALEQEFKVPEIKVPPAYGVKGTDIWLKELGRVLNREDEVEKIIKEGHEKVEPLIKKYREKFKGKRAYVTSGPAHGQAIIALLRELGFEIAGTSTFHHDPIYDNKCESLDVLKQDIDNYGDIKNYTVCNKQAYILVNSLIRTKPDIMIARHDGMTLWGAKLGIPSLLIGDEQLGFGYEGIINYAERIEETLDSIEFVANLSKHSSMPYSKWWINQGPEAYLGGDEKCQNS
ncbi:MAG: nitrogenase [Clostridium sp.]|nr:nitrogenase [Clostridium sp.]